jgi:Uma2 family endonuclease
MLSVPPVEELDVEDLVSLPRGYRYELHEGSLVITPMPNYWHKAMAGRLLVMLHTAGLEAFHCPGVRGGRPRDTREPDLGVVTGLPGDPATYSHLPGSAFHLVVEIVAEGSGGEYTDRAAWYAREGIPAYWIVDRGPAPSDDDAVVMLHRLVLSSGEPAYARERTIQLTDLEAEYRGKRADG